jgi:hypothetical protein
LRCKDTSPPLSASRRFVKWFFAIGFGDCFSPSVFETTHPAGPQNGPGTAFREEFLEEDRVPPASLPTDRERSLPEDANYLTSPDPSTLGAGPEMT